MFKLSPPIQPEQELHELVAQLLGKIVAPPAEWAFYPAGGVRLAARDAAKLSRMGLRRGWPDFLILCGDLYGVELKRVGAKLSKTRIGRTPSGAPRIYEGQEEVFPRLKLAGMKDIAICRSTDEVVAALQRWNVPLRGVILA